MFDRNARDIQSGITLDPRLERYERMFTEHLVNGERLALMRAEEGPHFANWELISNS